ncbi:ADP-ribosylglycohydrolase family protein [Nocardia bhagyanarayanae]|uniref:ADP-ribosylglycohydrolase n=1 Tax=Nocardia bhagyanarayanae TaxID=1215925 RepID=A0A543EWL7_9NOCA|nr:ADP-ribosylglycohydrolase family protein [Nocardia bhagyanarayanae]TQM25889.1 ADP-ribosylglycohydrolase [Nocardia bhagyanarayanae]
MAASSGRPTLSADRFGNRVRGVIVGTACGDALGWPQEQRGGLLGGQRARDQRQPEPVFRSWTRTAGHYRSRYRDVVDAGAYSDDTQLMLATARACLHGSHWAAHLVEVELPTWPIYQRGGGGAVLRAAASWARGVAPWRVPPRSNGTRSLRTYRDAGANGVAMRIAPHSICASGPSDLTGRVIRDGVTTHGHPRALVGALVYAHVLAYLLRAESVLGCGEILGVAERSLVEATRAAELLPEDWGTPEQVDEFITTWSATCGEMYQLLTVVDAALRGGSASAPEDTLRELGCCDSDSNGSGTITAAGAIFVAAHFADEPLSGLVAAAFLRKADTDTLASMAGGLLGAMHGYEWLGSLGSSVQDASYLVSVAADLSSGRGIAARPTVGRPPTLRRAAVDELVLSKCGDTGIFPDGRTYRVAAIDRVDEQRQRVRLCLDDGQSVILDTPIAPERKVRPHDSAEVSRKRSGGRLIETVLPTSDLGRCADFYGRLLGAELAVGTDTVTVVPGIAIRESRGGPEPAGGLEITLSVPAPEAALRRVGAEIVRMECGDFTATDPDGRRLTLRADDSE